MNEALYTNFSAAYTPGGTLEAELHRTAEMLVDIAEKRGVYYAVAFLYDSSYDLPRLRKLLPILKQKKGAIRKQNKAK